MFKKPLLILSIYLTATGVATATGLSVSPALLDFKITGDKNAYQKITVANPTADVMIFEAYPDEFEDIISARPESFTLEAGGRKEVVVTINAKTLYKSQTISTNISVIGKALAESKINVASGAKIPITILINPSTAKSAYAQYAWAGLAILIIVLLGVILN